MSDVQGFDRLMIKLQKLDAEMNEANAEAAEAAGKVLVTNAKRRVPVRSGKLRDSIKDRPYKVMKDSAQHLVYSSVFYADAVEKGPHKRPFMRPALDSSQEEMKDAANDVYREHARKVLNGG